MIDFKRLSKTMSHALRHAPDQYNLTLDAEGWVAVDDLLTALRGRRREWRNLQRSDIKAMMAAAKKQRYEISGNVIRAQYGHSTKQKIVKQPVEPPEFLYHGTSPKVVDAIRNTGLKPMRRQYVHLAADLETATIVGRRHHQKPIILIVDAQKAFANGIAFYREPMGIWLAEPIAPQFINFPEK